jgi:hypothetical protein
VINTLCHLLFLLIWTPGTKRRVGPVDSPLYRVRLFLRENKLATEPLPVDLDANGPRNSANQADRNKDPPFCGSCKKEQLTCAVIKILPTHPGFVHSPRRTLVNHPSLHQSNVPVPHNLVFHSGHHRFSTPYTRRTRIFSTTQDVCCGWKRLVSTF